jgi:hypothetical protein
MTDTIAEMTDPPGPTWTHKGVTITFRADNARFYAKLANGKRLNAPSLDAMKKNIEVEMENSFKPFTALIEGTGYTLSQRVKEHPESLLAQMAPSDKRYTRYLVRVLIVSYDRKETCYRDEDGQQQHTLIKDEPGALEAWRAWVEATLRKDEREAQLTAEINDARALIPWRTAKGEQA